MEYNVEKQHVKGKLHAIERINALCDKDTFVETYQGVKHNCTSFGMEKKEIPYDGVITGFGKINGRKVAVYAQDFTVQGGSLGHMHGRKIADLTKMAIDARCPVIGINDSGGARIQEGVEALGGYGNVFNQNVRASGAIPQISIIAGPCAGGAVYSPGITDFIFTVDQVTQMFITGPKVVKSVMFMDISAEDLGGASIHAQKSGVSHFRCDSEKECYEEVRRLLDYIPHYFGDKIEPKADIIKKKEVKITKEIKESNYFSIDTNCVGGSVTLTATANNGIPGDQLSYQWYRNGNPINGANAATYTTDDNLVAGLYEYQVEVASSISGCHVSQSGTIGITVEAEPTIVITSNAGNSICEGGDITLTANVIYATNATQHNNVYNYTWKWYEGTTLMSYVSTEPHYTLPATMTAGTYNFFVENFNNNPTEVNKKYEKIRDYHEYFWRK